MSPWRNQARHFAVVFTIMVVAPVRYRPWEVMGMGQVMGPEDLLYDTSGGGVIYTGSSDGWIKRVTVNDSVADTVTRTQGIGKGEGKVEVLVDEVEGVKFKFTDGIDVAEDGTIYFTDASYKYSLKNVLSESYWKESLISYDPSTNLYFWLPTSTWPTGLQSHQINNLWSSAKPPSEVTYNFQ
ncbi:hypothetical protein K1719_045711 [Acacia pycnantha]|nr:hypothetical protein K1719_045711 [Acacia pycnantha]